MFGIPRDILKFANNCYPVDCVSAYQGNPFSELAPTSSAGYVLNLRYPGQYYDTELGTNYMKCWVFRRERAGSSKNQ